MRYRRITLHESGNVSVSFERATGGMHGALFHAGTEEAEKWRRHVFIGNKRKGLIERAPVETVGR